ncbi:hypothetical protein BDR06DRAFT_959280 [Suillus hirtellus]|nr:hypothetical protein BDR06DRAFT_959280 [Suillus hirtellus]
MQRSFSSMHDQVRWEVVVGFTGIFLVLYSCVCFTALNASCADQALSAQGRAFKKYPHILHLC